MPCSRLREHAYVTEGTLNFKLDPRTRSHPPAAGGSELRSGEGNPMGRWPDNTRSTLTTFVLIFVLFPLLCAACWWFVKR